MHQVAVSVSLVEKSMGERCHPGKIVGCNLPHACNQPLNVSSNMPFEEQTGRTEGISTEFFTFSQACSALIHLDAMRIVGQSIQFDSRYVYLEILMFKSRCLSLFE